MRLKPMSGEIAKQLASINWIQGLSSPAIDKCCDSGGPLAQKCVPEPCG